MRFFIEKIIRRVIASVKYRANRMYHEQIIFRLFNKEKVFESIWKKNYWGDADLALR